MNRSEGPPPDHRRVADDREPSTASSAPIELRDASPSEVARCLRSMLGLAPNEPAPGELAASFRHPAPRLIERLDAGGWIAWCLAGLPLFAGRLPSLRRVGTSSRRVALVLAMVRSRGNISAAARVLDTSRKVFRDNLRRADLYPWPGHDADRDGAVRGHGAAVTDRAEAAHPKGLDDDRR